MKNDILITGGNGLVGSEFKEGIRFRSSDYDLRCPDQTEKLIKKYAPKHVIHAAGRVGGVGANINYVGEFFYENIMMNTNVIHSCMNNNVDRLICFLSTCIFPDVVDYPLTEDKIHLGPPHKSNFGYAYAKRMAQVQLDAYNQQYGTKYFSVIPTNVYGPNDNYNLESSHLIPAIIHKVYLAKTNGTDLVIWGDGSPLREFVYSKDVARVCELLLDQYDDTRPVIISTSQEISIKEIVKMIADIFDYKGKIVYDTSRPNGQHRKPSDNSFLKTVINDFEFTPIEVGLGETIEHFIANYKNIKR
jgi:GDP-L-fucose synthase